MSKNTNFKKNISTTSLMLTGLTSIMGSGWLLATQKISTIAGPAGVLSWFFGMLIAILIACFCIEIGTAYPSSGGIGFYSTITHGRFSGFLTQWINWLSILAVPAIEAQAIIQYISSINNYLGTLYDVKTHCLTSLGIVYAILLLFIFVILNLWGNRFFIKFNNVLTIIKIVIPTLTIITLFYKGFHVSNFGSNIHEFIPYGINSIAISIISCGVVMSFNGFQTPLTFSEEIKNPKKQLPIAVIGCILISFLIYELLQIVFVGSLSPNDLKHGWVGIDFSSPYVTLLIALNFQVIAWSVMATSIIAPFSAGVVFLASCTRLLYKLSDSRFIPKFFSIISQKTGIPYRALWLNFLLGIPFLLITKGWSTLVIGLSVLHVFSYLSMPIVVVAFRFLPVQKKQGFFKVPYVSFFALLTLFVLSILLFSVAWPNVLNMTYLLLPGIFLYLFYENKKYNYKNILKSILNGLWLVLLIGGIDLISYLGKSKPAHNIISTNLSMFLLFLLTLFVFALSLLFMNQVYD